MRYLPNVVRQIESLVPDNFELYKLLIKSLNSISESYRYAPPETQGIWWHRLAETLQCHLKEPDENWKVAICEVLSGESPPSVEWMQEGF